MQHDFPIWLSRALVVGLLGWLLLTSHQNSVEVSGLNVEISSLKRSVDMLVQVIIPSGRRAEVRP